MTSSSAHETWRGRSNLYQRVKSAPVSLISQLAFPLLINSFGRSGSTVLHRSVSASALRPLFSRMRGDPARLIRGEAWRLDRTYMTPGRCYKSHDYPSIAYAGRPPVAIYVFSDPVDAILSTLEASKTFGSEWFSMHCRHLGVEPFEPQRLIDGDCLNIERHFDSWRSQRSIRCLFIRYEMLWNLNDKISDELGFALALPERRPRTSYSHWPVSQVSSTYELFSRRLDSFADFEILDPERGRR